MYFNPRSPHGERPGSASAWVQTAQFQSTLPARGATTWSTMCCFAMQPFQSTLPARGATCLQSAIERDVSISIHAPRTGSDSEAYDAYEAVMISIHAPRTGSDRRSRRTRSSASDFNPRSPHGERPGRMPESTPARDFNPRSPHGERRGVNQGIDDILRFQSTLPARGATFDAFQRRVSVSISIHAPRTGSDGSFQTEGEVYPHFNPRSPHGERPSRALTTLPPC